MSESAREGVTKVHMPLRAPFVLCPAPLVSESQQQGPNQPSRSLHQVPASQPPAPSAFAPTGVYHARQTRLPDRFHRIAAWAGRLRLGQESDEMAGR
jgi:hypothetical protein